MVALDVHRHAALLGHDLRQVQREAERTGKVEGVDAGEDLRRILLQSVGLLGEEAGALVDRAVKVALLALEDAHDGVAAPRQLREGAAERGHQSVDDARHERPVRGLDSQKPLRVPHRAAQDAAQDVAAAQSVGHGAVGDGEGQRADVVRHHAVRHVDGPGVLGADAAAVRRREAGELLDGGEERREDVGVVVGHLALEDGGEALKAHARVDVLVRQRLQARGVAVVLDEDVVPDLQNVRVVEVDQVRRVAAADAVVVDLRAGAAGARVAHLPKVVAAVKGEDALGGHVLEPDAPRLLVGGHARRAELVASEVCHVQSVRVQAKGHGEALPGHGDGLLLEVVAEAPVAQHLEEGVVVEVLAHVVEVVMLAARADALLRIRSALQLGHRRVWVHRAEEDGLVLVHARVGEEERWVLVGHDG
mmetsp:Transcript_12867/g.42976  ORF Transcript_12867/g.42976 Transcript_12867/m.42976 type:complete len:420 (+) Transcript_12867:1711-2970(+)